MTTNIAILSENKLLVCWDNVSHVPRIGDIIVLNKNVSMPLKCMASTIEWSYDLKNDVQVVKIYVKPFGGT